MTVTTTSHWSCEMVVSLGPQGTFVMGTKAKPVTVAQYQRRLMCTRVSTILTNCLSFSGWQENLRPLLIRGQFLGGKSLDSWAICRFLGGKRISDHF
jgi:hypothetical protein